MKKTMTFFLAVLSIITLQAQTPKTTWNLDKAHSSVTFNIAHMVISEVEGKFTNFNADIKSDKADFTDARGSFTVALNSVNTGTDKRDDHLRSADFFDVENNPNMTFVIKKITKVNSKAYKITGDLTLHGVTKSITLDAKFGGVIKDPYGMTRAGFTVTGEINRYDFGLKYNAVMEAGGLTIGKTVKIKINLELTKA